MSTFFVSKEVVMQKAVISTSRHSQVYQNIANKLSFQVYESVIRHQTSYLMNCEAQLTCELTHLSTKELQLKSNSKAKRWSMKKPAKAKGVIFTWNLFDGSLWWWGMQSKRRSEIARDGDWLMQMMRVAEAGKDAQIEMLKVTTGGLHHNLHLFCGFHA